MTTEELENKLKISENTCIHCPTLELAKQISNIFHKLGLKWCNKKHYIRNTNWDKHEENTLYYPFEGLYSSLKFADLTGYKVINAEEFITLHTEEFDLESYEPKGDLKDFPKEIIAHMLDYQEEQGNKRNVTVFEKQCDATQYIKGFEWGDTQEGWDFWHEVITNKNFNIFFEKYPKQDYQDNTQDTPQEFRVGDEVIDIITGQRGKISEINTNDGILPMYVSLNEGEYFYTLDGRHFTHDKYPRLLHYRNDYDYSIIDFNNLPKRQKVKRWRTEKEGEYYFIRFYIEDWFYISATKEYNSYYDSINYNSGNYFQTKEEAQEVAEKLNKYFKELINPNS